MLNLFQKIFIREVFTNKVTEHITLLSKAAVIGSHIVEGKKTEAGNTAVRRALSGPGLPGDNNSEVH